MASDYAASQAVFRRYSRTYYLSSLFFPPDVRRHVNALYAFVRLPDEYVDNPGADPAGDLAAFRAEYEVAWRTGSSDDPILRAFIATAWRFDFPREWPDAFLDAMESDLSVSRYETFEDLRAYVYGSAEVVGLMMARILGVPPEGYPHAQQLGLAMQLTNFHRDIGDDWVRRGRIYVPLEDLRRFGIREDEWNGRIYPAKFRALMRFQGRRDFELYRAAHVGLRHIPGRSRLAVALASHAYQQTLRGVLCDPMAVWERRVSWRPADGPPLLLRAWTAAYARRPA
jgi:phytoene synthase